MADLPPLRPRAPSTPSDADASPFHVKGNVYLGTHHFFEKQVAGGVAALYENLEPELRAFLEQRFMPVGWYDVMPVIPLIRAEAKTMGLTLPRYLRLRSMYQAERDLSGVYRFLLKLASAEMVALRLPRLVTQVFDFGTPAVELVGEGHVEARFEGVPAALNEWFATAFEAYGEAALRLAGGHHVQVNARPAKPSGSAHGHELVSLAWRMRWR